MTMPGSQNAVLLGGGGLQPRLDALSPSGDLTRLVELPLGQSIYSVDICPTDKSLALGTKSGQLLVLMNPWGETDDREAPPHLNLVQGSPVLSVCWWDSNLLAASDMAGRVLLWDLKDHTQPRYLTNPKKTVCSLCRINDGMLGGLTTDGIILVWQPGGVDPAAKIKSVPPPSKYALVNLAYNPWSGVINYPGQQGRLISVQLNDESQRDFKAHEGDFYAHSAGEARTVTAGLEDRNLKVWQGFGEHLVREQLMPTGIVSLAGFPENPELLALVTAEGRVEIMNLDNSRFRQGSNSGSGEYRSSFPSVSSDQAITIRVKTIKELASRLEAALNQDDPGVVTTLHESLAELGYEQVALAIRSARAFEHENFLDSLRHSLALTELLPQNDPRSTDSLYRHAQLLTRFWIVDQANELYEQLQKVDPSVTNPLGELSSIDLNDGAESWVIVDSDIDLEEIIEANNILGRCFRGVFVFSRQDTSWCQGMNLAPGELAREFAPDSGCFSAGAPVQCQSLEVDLVERSGIKRETILKFDSGDNKTTPLSLGLIVHAASTQTAITPLILFTWYGQGDFHTNNGRALTCLRQIRNGTLSTEHLDLSYKSAMDLIRRMATKNRNMMSSA